MIQEIFSKNLDALAKRYPLLSEKIEKLSLQHIKLKEQNGLFNIFYESDLFQGYVHFKDDPVKEAEELIEKSRASLTKAPRILFFYGIGLGYHLLKYLEKPFEDNTFIIIIEKEAELFKAALMVHDFTTLLENTKVHFFIDQPLETLTETLISFWYKDSMFYMMNCLYNIIFEGSLKINSPYYIAFSKAISDSLHFVYHSCGNSCNDAYIGVQNTIQNLEVLISSKNLESLKGRFKGIPGFLICSGPSLNKNLDKIKLLKNKGVIACCYSALKPVYEAKGSSHFVTTIERGEILSEFYRNLSDNIKAVLISPPLLSGKVFENYNRQGLVVFNKNNTLDLLNTGYSSYYLGQTCSNLGMVALDILGCSPIVLIGNDLSYNQIDGESHVTGAIANNDLNMFLENPQSVMTDLGNNGQSLKTKESWIRFKKSFEFIIQQNNIECFNVNDDRLGLFIKGAKLINFDDLLNLLPDKDFLIEPEIENMMKPVTNEELNKTRTNYRSALEKYREYLMGNKKRINDGKNLLKTLEPVTPLKLNQLLKEMESFWKENEYFNGMLLDVIQPEHVPIMINLYELTGDEPAVMERKKDLIIYWYSLLDRWNQTLYILLSAYIEGENFEKVK